MVSVRVGVGCKVFDVRNNRDIVAFTCFFTTIACSVVAGSTLVMFGPQVEAGVMIWAVSNAFVLTAVLTAIGARHFKRTYDLSERLKTLVRQDMLTGTSSREHFFRTLQQDPTARGVVVMLDLDHFKMVNDTFGHLGGDMALQRVGKILRRMIRSGDVVCRFGGEEFVVFLREASVADAQDLAQRIRARIADQKIVVDGQQIRVTASFGIAMTDAAGELEKALRLADAALYAAKARGRNCVVTSDETLVAAAAAHQPRLTLLS